MSIRACVLLFVCIAMPVFAYGDSSIQGRVAAITGNAELQIQIESKLLTLKLSHLDCSKEQAETLSVWLRNRVGGKQITARAIETGPTLEVEVFLDDGMVVNQSALRDGLCALDPKDPDPRGIYKRIAVRQSNESAVTR